MASSPRRGEIWLVDLGMAAKVRPALVISVPAGDADRALVTLVPHTTSPRQSRFEASVSVPFLRAGVFDAQNLITIPHAKLVRSLGLLSPAQLAVAERAVQLWLGMTATTQEALPEAFAADGGRGRTFLQAASPQRSGSGVAPMATRSAPSQCFAARR